MKSLVTILAIIGVIFIRGGAQDGGGAPSVTAAFTARPIQGTPCVAPCAMHFDAIGLGDLSTVPYVTEETTDSVYTREFHSLLYSWDFGDNGSGACGGAGAVWTTYTQSAAPLRNEDIGPIAGHMYCSPGTYTVTLTVRNPAGGIDTQQHDVTIADPEVEFTDANTFCFTPDTTPDWTGCPLDCAGGDDNCTIIESYSSAVNNGNDCGTTDATDDCANADTDMRRLYFQKGQTFTVSTTTNFFNGSTPGLVTSFGTGAKPIISGNLNESSADNQSHWTFADLDVRGTITPEGGRSTGGGSSNLTYYALDLTQTGTSQCIFDTVFGGTDNRNFLRAFVDLTCTGTASSGTLVWIDMRYGMLLGGVYDRNNGTGGAGGDYTMRTKTWQHSVMAHSNWVDARQDHWQFRPEHNAPTLTANQEATMYNNIHENILDLPATSNAPVFRTCLDDACTCTAGSSMTDDCDPVSCPSPPGTGPCPDPTRGKVVDSHDWIVEQNLFRYGSGTSGSPSKYIQILGGDYTIRNNIIDARLNLSTGANDAALVDAGGEPSHQTGTTVSHTNIHVFNNTFYSTTATVNKVFSSTYNQTFENATGCTSSCLDYNNLCVMPNKTGTGTLCGTVGGVFTVANNLGDTGTDPFDGTIPAEQTSTMADFVPSSGEATIVNAGRDFTGADTSFWNHLDGRSLCRPDSTEWDIGAIERSAVDICY